MENNRIKMRCIIFIFLIVFHTVLSEDIESRLIYLIQGPVRGYKDSQDDVFVFYGIPYATAPTGPDKFKAPLPAPTWSKPLDAVNKVVVCPQSAGVDIITDSLTEKEDCLIANIYLPNTNEKNLPVIVYVHGGGFIIGFGNLATPKKLVTSKKVIAVTFNYRLAAHGFLCLGTKDIPGNGGMKDQVALLRWVKVNIKRFGGNPDDVTIAGYSAGGSSVGLLMLSKMAKGLFNKVIPESGDITSPFSVQVDPIRNAREYAKLLNFTDVNDVYVLESFYKNASYKFLHSAVVGLRPDSSFVVTPCVERDIDEERFLEDDPYSIIKQSDFEKLPMLYGFTNMDGLMRIEAFDLWKDKMNTNFEDFLPPDLQFTNHEEKKNVVKSIKKFYFADKVVDNSAVLDYVNYFTDVMFACPTLRTIKLLLEAGSKNIYLYEYSYTDDSTPTVPYTNVKGAGHCAQTVCILDGNITFKDEKSISNDLIDWKNLMRGIWLNFIIKGIPESFEIPEWLPVKGNGTPYMSLKRSPEVKEFLLKDRCGFWEEIYGKYYQTPIPPTLVRS